MGAICGPSLRTRVCAERAVVRRLKNAFVNSLDLNTRGAHVAVVNDKRDLLPEDRTR